MSDPARVRGSAVRRRPGASAARVLHVAAVVAVACALALAATARAQESPAPPDTSFQHYLETLADSTDRYFGISATRPDTTGLDSALVAALARPQREVAPFRFGANPDFNFNRVDGPVWGAGVSARRHRRGAVVGASAGYAAGPNDWLWNTYARKTWDLRTLDWTVRVAGGRATNVLDRDRSESSLAIVRSLLIGRDRRHYLRREGAGGSIEVAAPLWRFVFGYRDEVEKPLATTTTWNLLHNTITNPFNLAAAPGRAREFEYQAAWLMPWWPITFEAIHQTSSSAIDSDFEYRRTRASVSGKFGLGRFATLIPQFSYGRTTLSLTPQSAFYLGGSHSLRSIPGSALGGSGAALARADLIGARDLLALAHVPHPEMFPIQGGLFVASGAVWGPDPYGGPTRQGVGWPGRSLWFSETGVALFYQPGVPDANGFIRLSYAIPLGSNFEEVSHFSVSYTRALDLVRPFGD